MPEIKKLLRSEYFNYGADGFLVKICHITLIKKNKYLQI